MLYTIDMKTYTCSLCNKVFQQKSHYQAHLQRKTPCTPVDEIKKVYEPQITYLTSEIDLLKQIVQRLENEVENLKGVKNWNNGGGTNAKIEPLSYNEKKSIPATVKRLVWNRYIGEETGRAKCFCCRVTDITQLSFHCGHVVSQASGGATAIHNLRPLCQNCNCSMGTTNMEDFIAYHQLHN